MRLRIFADVRDDVENEIHRKYIYTDPPAQPSIYNDTAIVPSRRHSDIMEDVVIKDFQKRVNAGEVFFNPMQRIVSTTEYQYGTFTFDYQSATKPWYDTEIRTKTLFASRFGFSNPEFTISGSLPSPLDLNTQGPAASKIDKSTYAFAEDVAELHKTLKTLRDIFTGATALFKLLFERASVIGLAKAWLEMRYSFRPILISLYNLSEMVETNAIEKMKQKPVRKTARHSSSVAGSIRKFRTRAHSMDSSVTSQHEIEINRTIMCRTSILYESPPGNPVLTTLGLRLSDVPKTMWAVMPYSWVIDHFVNISKYIDAVVHVCDPNVKILGGTTTTTIYEQTTERQGAYSWVSTNGEHRESFTGSVVKSVAMTKSRTPFILPNIGIGQFVEIRLDIAFIADLLSLIVVHSH